MSVTQPTYFVVANYPERGRLARPLSHAEFLQSVLDRATEKLGARPNVVRCHPSDRPAFAALAKELEVVESDMVQPNEFWLGLQSERPA